MRFHSCPASDHGEPIDRGLVVSLGCGKMWFCGFDCLDHHRERLRVINDEILDGKRPDLTLQDARWLASIGSALMRPDAFGKALFPDRVGDQGVPVRLAIRIGMIPGLRIGRFLFVVVQRDETVASLGARLSGISASIASVSTSIVGSMEASNPSVWTIDA